MTATPFTTTDTAAAEADFGAYLASKGHTLITGPDTERNYQIEEGGIVKTGDKTADFTSRNHKAAYPDTTPAGAKVTLLKEYQAQKGMTRLTVYIANYGTFRLVYSY